MALTSLIPNIWSARFIANLDNFMVYGNAVNRDYQPDAVYGNVIKAPSLGDVTISDYTADTDHAGTQILNATTTDILIDKQKMYNFEIDDIAEAQSNPMIIDKAMERASMAMAQVVDTDIASTYVDAGITDGSAAVPISPTATDIYALLTKTAQSLDENNVPTYGRYFIMSPAGIKLLKDAGEFLSDTIPGDILRAAGQFSGGTLPNGYKGEVAGFSLWMSNNTPSEGASTSIWTAGHRMSNAFVDSFNKIVAYVPELRFAEAVKGLYVYGTKVTAPGALAAVYTDI